ncbi:MAG: hypothetical protein RL156_905, partial [Bacteroidota bacterium]
MKILRIVLLLIIASTVPGIVSSTMLFAQTPIYRTSTMYDEPGSEGREHPLDFERLRLTIKFDANAGKVFGDVTEMFTP